MNVVEASNGLSLPTGVCASSRIRGDSPMARLLRERDWRGTPLGEVAGWPKELVTSLNLVLGSPIATSLYWGADHVLLYNDAYRQFMGDRHPGAVGSPGSEVWREAWHLVGPQIEQTFATGESFAGEGFLVPIEQDGRMVDHYWDYSFSPVYDVVSGRVAGVYNTSVNATAGVMAERERKALADRLQQVLECTSESVIMIGRDWRFTYLNRAAEVFAHPVTGLLGKVIWEALPGLVYDGSPNVYHYERAMYHGESSEFESYYAAPINRWRHIQVRPTPEGIVLFARDTTEQKRADAALKASNEALAASEEELRWTIALSSQMTWTADVDGMILKHSGDLAALPGHSGEEVLGNAWTSMMHLEDVERMKESWSHCVRTGQPYDIEFRILNTTGGHHWFRARAFPRRDAEGRIVKWYGITEDIDERKQRAAALERTAAALAASEEELLWTVKMSTQNPWTADAAGRLLSADEGLEVTGVAKENLLGEGWIDVVHPEDAPGMTALWAHCVATGEAYEIEHRLQTGGGEYRWHRARAFPRRDGNGRVIKWYGTSEDIHARKQAEEALRTTEKLAAVGRLATSIAHEINNPLEAVTNLLYLARTSGELPEVLGYIKDAEQELHRASVITNQTLRFQRQSSGAVALYSEDLVENCLAVFQGKLQNSAVVPERRLRALRAVTCYDGEIRQVFLNLVGNAIDAMQPGGGRLLIRTREATHPVTGKPGLVLTVADTGSGISAETRAKLFAPFFTTKGLNGTGLGLWVSQEIVDRHHGSLRLRSKPRRRKTDANDPGGTVFTLFLPFDAAARHPVSVPAARALDAVAA